MARSIPARKLSPVPLTARARKVPIRALHNRHGLNVPASGRISEVSVISEGEYAKKHSWALSGGEAVPTFEATQVADSVLTRARLLSKAVTAICDDKLRPFGISSTQFALLIAVCRIEPVTRAEIARLQHLNKSTLTRDLKAVLSEGWIEEVRKSANGRSRPVALTRVGKELILNARPAWLKAQVQAEALLGVDGITALINITDRIHIESCAKSGRRTLYS